MKVYSISKWTFLGICLLILALPISRHWKLFTNGGRTRGTVTQYVVRTIEDIAGNKKLEEASEIEYEVDGVRYKAYGPANYEYPQGRIVTIFYKRKNPAKCCVATFTGFYLNNYIVLPMILITVWYAFYLSFNNYRKRLKIPKGRPSQAAAASTQASLINRDEEPLSR
jgi:hypothetical protein